MSGLTAAAAQLLRNLAEQGAYGFCLDAGEPRILAVVGQCNGVSLRRASAPFAAAVELERRALAAWQGDSGTRRRFMLTVHGWNAVSERLDLEACAGDDVPVSFFPPQADADAELRLSAGT